MSFEPLLVPCADGDVDGDGAAGAGAAPMRIGPAVDTIAALDGPVSVVVVAAAPGQEAAGVQERNSTPGPTRDAVLSALLPATAVADGVPGPPLRAAFRTQLLSRVPPARAGAASSVSGWRAGVGGVGGGGAVGVACCCDPTAGAPADFHVGQAVTHPKRGAGTVASVCGGEKGDAVCRAAARDAADAYRAAAAALPPDDGGDDAAAARAESADSAHAAAEAAAHAAYAARALPFGPPARDASKRQCTSLLHEPRRLHCGDGPPARTTHAYTAVCAGWREWDDAARRVTDAYRARARGAERHAVLAEAVARWLLPNTAVVAAAEERRLDARIRAARDDADAAAAAAAADDDRRRR
eukprot:gene11859-18311_t